MQNPRIDENNLTTNTAQITTVAVLLEGADRQRLATGWKVGESNLGSGEIFPVVQTGPEVHPDSCKI